MAHPTPYFWHAAWPHSISPDNQKNSYLRVVREIIVYEPACLWLVWWEKKSPSDYDPMAGGNGNDLETHIYSADGRIFQVEYAAKCVETNCTVLGICCLDGVIIAVENTRASNMLEATSNPRTYAIDRHIGAGVAGRLPDGNYVVRVARVESIVYRRDFNISISGVALAQRVGTLLHSQTLDGGSRPLGCTMLVASFGDEGPQLHMIDPSGTVAGYHACVAGKGKIVAKTALEGLDFTTLTCEQAIQHAGRILNDAHDPLQDKLWDIEMAWVSEKTGRKFEKVPASMIPAKTK